MIEDYGIFSINLATDTTIAWLDLNLYTWWHLATQFSHGNYTWRPTSNHTLDFPSDLWDNSTPYRLIQFKGYIKQNWITSLLGNGTLVGYSSNQTAIANMTDAGLQALQDAGLVFAVERVHAGLKLAPGWEALVNETDYLVATDPNLPVSAVLSEVTNISGVTLHDYADHSDEGFMSLIYLNATQTAIRQVAGVDAVIAVQNVTKIGNFGYESTGHSMSNLTNAGHQLAWYWGIDGSGEIVTVAEHDHDLDAAARPTHEAFADTMPDGTARPGDRHVHVTHPMGFQTPRTFEDVWEDTGGNSDPGGLAGHAIRSAGVVGADMPSAGQWDYGDWNGDGFIRESDGYALGVRSHWQMITRNSSSSLTSFGLPPDLLTIFADSHEWICSEAGICSAPGVGAAIHTNSWRWVEDAATPIARRYGIMASQIDNYTWSHPDFVTVHAAGNAGEVGMDSMAMAKNTITVGASGIDPDKPVGGLEDNGYWWNGLKRTFAPSWGAPVADWPGDGPDEQRALYRLKPLVVAPTHVETTIAGSSWGRGTGTSIAAPQIAAQAALVRQYYREGFHPSGNGNAADSIMPSAALVRASLISGAHEIRSDYGDEENGAPPETTGRRYPTFRTGWGRHVADDVLYFWNESGNGPSAAQRKLLAYDRQPVTLSGGTTTCRTHAFTVQDVNVPLNVTFAWRDYHAAPLAVAGPLIVNLNLEVRAPDGTRYHGNVMQEPRDGKTGESLSLPSGDKQPEPDRLNVEEVVRVAVPPTGVWEVRVYPMAAPTAGEYALVITGAVESGEDGTC